MTEKKMDFETWIHAQPFGWAAKDLMLIAREVWDAATAAERERVRMDSLMAQCGPKDSVKVLAAMRDTLENMTPNV